MDSPKEGAPRERTMWDFLTKRGRNGRKWLLAGIFQLRTLSQYHNTAHRSSTVGMAPYFTVYLLGCFFLLTVKNHETGSVGV